MYVFWMYVLVCECGGGGCAVRLHIGGGTVHSTALAKAFSASGCVPAADVLYGPCRGCSLSALCMFVWTILQLSLPALPVGCVL